MSWWGKVLGGTFGFMLGGPLGALLGASIGHSFDTGLERGASIGFDPGSQERVQTAFFTATFSVMGYVAKADGRVSEAEIGLARNIMEQMRLHLNQKQAAIKLFDQGKQTDFPIDDVINQFRKECRRRHTLMQMFLEIQLHAAYADGVFDPAEKQLLENISRQLGFSASEFLQMEALVRGQRFSKNGTNTGKHQTNAEKLNEAYSILGINKNCSLADVKKSYRRLMNQHHPDKLVAKGLPEEMIKIATEKTHEIRSAYEMVRDSRIENK